MCVGRMTDLWSAVSQPANSESECRDVMVGCNWCTLEHGSRTTTVTVGCRLPSVGIDCAWLCVGDSNAKLWTVSRFPSCSHPSTAVSDPDTFFETSFEQLVRPQIPCRFGGAPSTPPVFLSAAALCVAPQWAGCTLLCTNNCLCASRLVSSLSGR